MKAEDYVTQWCNKTYKDGKELGDWTTAEVMKFANDFSNEKLRLLGVTVENQVVCSHPDKYFVPGVFGGWWCPKCNRNVNDDCE